MKIVVLTTSYPRFPGDPTGQFIIGQARALAALGHQVEIIAPHDPTVPTAAHEDDGAIQVRRFHYWWPPRAGRLCYGAGIPENFRRSRLVAAQVPGLIAGFARRALPAARGADIVHGHWLFGGLAALWVARAAGRPCVVTLHGAEALAPLLRPANRYLVSHADAVVVNSRFTRETIQAYAPAVDPIIIPFGANAEKMAPPGFDREAFRAAAGLPQDAFVVLAVGRLVARKGFHVLVEAASREGIRERLQLVIGGDGPERQALEAQIKTLNVSERVRLLGRIDDAALACWYAAADIFALPAVPDSSGDTEGLGVVLLEAMANRTPVIASRTGGITDVVIDGETGLLAQPGDADDLAAQIRRLLDDPALGRRLVDGAANRLEREFGWEATTRRLCAAYESVRR